VIGNICRTRKEVVEHQTELDRRSAARAVLVQREQDLQRLDQPPGVAEQPGPLAQ
jgi:hypothetical protein